MDLHRLGRDVERVSDSCAGLLGIVRDDAWYLLKLQEEVGELTQAYLMRAGQARTRGMTPEEIDAGFRAELADVLCHVLLMARHHGMDLAAEVERKWLARLPGEPEVPRGGASGSGVT
ncbi:MULTISPECIES: pyrophosphatase [unclassified Nonomuraea]|uniref:pyrophosphatase n=1 Tax=unclassified Nonomuraea TaxID=2593643 RepID=UPI003401273E